MAGKPTVVQLVRHIGEGSGVGSVVLNIERQLMKQGFATERLTLGSTGLKSFKPHKSRIINKLFLMREVLWFSVVGTLLAKHRYSGSKEYVTMCHGDPVFGDIYVNHGTLKQAMRERTSPVAAIARNPMHWFTLLRDEYRYASRQHSVIVSLTSTDRSQLEANYSRLKTDGLVIPNGVDTDKFRPPSQTERSSVRLRMGLTEAQKVILFVGHEFDRKGLFLLLEALGRLPEQYLVHVVGGDAAMIRIAQAKSEEYGVGKRVTFWGGTPDAREYYWAADVFCLPTSYETGPLVLLEALASGVPSLISPVGLGPEVIVDGANGYIIPLDASGISERILDSTAASVHDDMRIASRQSIQSYSWEHIGAQYGNLIASIYERRRLE